MTAFIDEHCDQFGVEAICRVLSTKECGFITSRGYRAAKTKPPSDRALEDELLVPEIRRIHAENYSVYGVRKMHQAVVRAGWVIGRDHVARLMKLAGVEGVRRGRKPITTRPAGEPDTRPDLVERRFTAERPHQLWVADITYVRTISGFCLSRVHHRRLLPAHRGMGGLGQPSHRGAAVARPRARPREQRRQPRPPRPDPPLGPRRPGWIQSVVATPSRNHWRYGRWQARTGRGRSVTCPRGHVGSGERIGPCGPRCALLAGRSPHERCNASSGV